MKQTLYILAGIYVVGVAVEYYRVPDSDPSRLQKSLFWPVYLVEGIIGVAQGTHTVNLAGGNQGSTAV